MAEESARWADQGLRLRTEAWLVPLLLACALALWFGYELGTRALWSPDEGRYAEIPREMVASGDYLTPRLNGVKYFEKPPLMYWMTAASIRLFGVNEWSLRLWPALLALLGCMTVYFLGLRLYGRAAGVAAAAVLALNPLYDLLGGVLSLDMPVSVWITVALAAFLLGVREPPGARRRGWLTAFYVCVALAVLTKGLVGIVLPGLVIGAWIAVLGEWRLLRGIHLGAGLVIVLAIAAPWHVLVSRSNPDFAQFYFVHEHLQRYLTTQLDRYQPAWYFLPVLLVGFFPWSALSLAALRASWPRLWRERRERREQWFLLLWAAVPLAFFSLSGSKLIPYILPMLPPLALAVGASVARHWQRGAPPGPAALRLMAALGLLLGAVGAAAPWLRPESPSLGAARALLGGGYFALCAAWPLAALAPWLAARRGAGRAAWVALFAGAALVALSLDLTLARLEAGRSVKTLALALQQRLRPQDEVITYQEYFYDLPVYLGRRVTVVGWRSELEFGAQAEDTSAWMLEDAAFQRRWLEPRTIYLVASRLYYDALRANPPGPMCALDADARVVVSVNRECP